MIDPCGGNPLLVTDGLPRFDAIEPEYVVPAVRRILEQSRRELEQLEAGITPTWNGLVERLERMDRPFEYGWSPVSHLLGVKNSDQLRAAYEAVLGEVVEFGLRLSQSRPIYDALKEIRDGDEWDRLDKAQRRIIEKRILSAELAGIGLDDTKRERFNAVAAELSQHSTDFSNHVLDATKAFELILDDPDDVAGLPLSLRQLMAQSYNHNSDDEQTQASADAGPWRVTLEIPCYSPFMEHCRRRELRENLYRAFVCRASAGDIDNTPLISCILKLRAEQAKLLGFDNFAAVSLAQKMAPDVAAIEMMFETLRAASWDAALRDLRESEQLARDSGQEQPLAHWDVGFWAERLREQRFDYTDEQLRPYFPLPRVLEGLFSLVNRLFGVTIAAADGKAPIWHRDVRFFDVINESGEHCASFYLDPYSRPEDKRGGAWMDDCLGRCRINGTVRRPVAHLVCNGTPPVGDRPSLMTFREVETLFHEFGHGLQHMLTTVDYSDAAGISGVEWDAVELPSQFMENWCYHKPTLLGITSHVETGESLPEDLFEKLCRARTYRCGTMMLRQLLFGMTDIELHTTFDPDGDETVFDVQRRISERTSPMPMLPENRFLCAFQHIFAGGYSAGYYSYKWAEVLSADAFSAFEEAGLDDDQAVRRIGRSFRDTVLAQGGSRHPMDIFREFRGREPRPDALLKHNGLA